MLTLLLTSCSRQSSGNAHDKGNEGTASHQSPLLLKQVVIRDPGRGNMAAHQLLVPEGWKVEGGIQVPPPSYNMIPYLSDVTIKAPDKRGVRFWGINEYGYADNVNLRPFTPYEGRPYFRPQRSLGDFWLHIFELNPGEGITQLKVVSESELPELTELVRKQLASLYHSTEQENRQLAMSGMSMEFDVQGRRLVVRYLDAGTEVEATIFATVRHTAYRYANGQVKAGMWTLDNMYAAFGPAGTDYLNDPALCAIVRSRQELPEWQAAIQQTYLMMQQQIVARGRAAMAAAARQAAVSRQSQSEDVLDISFNGWKSRNAMSDAGHASDINAIHERTTYATPAGTTVNLPSYYQNVYADQQGNYLMHNDANYEVNTDPTFNSRNWERITPTQ